MKKQQSKQSKQSKQQNPRVLGELELERVGGGSGFLDSGPSDANRIIER